MRRHKVDANQQAIIEALKAAGASVLDLSGIGGGSPDILCGWHGFNILIEIKNPAGRGNRLTPAEREFMDNWRGQTGVVSSVEEALILIEDLWLE